MLVVMSIYSSTTSVYKQARIDKTVKAVIYFQCIRWYSLHVIICKPILWAYMTYTNACERSTYPLLRSFHGCTLLMCGTFVR